MTVERCHCCGSPSLAPGRTICHLCIESNCRISSGCNRKDDDA